MYKHPEIDYTPEHPSLKNYDVGNENHIIMNLQNMGYTAFPDGTPFEFSAGFFSKFKKHMKKAKEKLKSTFKGLSNRGHVKKALKHKIPFEKMSKQEKELVHKRDILNSSSSDGPKS